MERLFSNEGEEVDVLLDLSQRDCRLNLGAAFADALLEHGKRLGAQELDVPRSHSRWSGLLELLNTAARTTVLRDLREYVLQGGRPVLKQLLQTYGGPFATQCPWVEDADRAVRGLFSDIVTDGDEEELEWLGTVFDDNEDALKKAKRESRITLLDRIVSRLESSTLDEESRRAQGVISEALQKRIQPARSKVDPQEQSLFQRAKSLLLGSGRQDDSLDQHDPDE